MPHVFLQAKIDFLRRASSGRFCFVWTTPTYRRLQRRGTLLRLTYRLSRGGGIYTGGISSAKKSVWCGLQHELFAVKRYCHRAAECKSVSDVCRQKVLPRGEALRLANVRSPQSLRMPACLLRPLNAGNKRYCFSDMPTFVGRLLLWRRHWSFVFPNALTCAVGD